MGTLRGPAPVITPSNQPSDENPYWYALDCIRSQLTAEQRGIYFGIGYFLDRTGREAYAPSDAQGHFMPQGPDDILATYIAMTGVQWVETNPVHRQQMAYVMPRMMVPDPSDTTYRQESRPQRVVAPAEAVPDVYLSGSLGTLDMLPGWVVEGNAFGISAGTRANGILVSGDIRAIRGAQPMRFDAQRRAVLTEPAGARVAGFPFSKVLVGYEDRAGITRFAGAGRLFSFDMSRRGREPLQYSQRVILARVAYQIVADVFHITACQAQVEYGDHLASGDFLPSTVSPPQAPAPVAVNAVVPALSRPTAVTPQAPPTEPSQTTLPMAPASTVPPAAELGLRGTQSPELAPQ